MKAFKFKIVYHLLFWAISFAILYSLFTKDYDNGLADIVYTVLFHLPLLPLVYINIFLIRKYLLKGKYLPYILGMSLVVGICLGFHYVLFGYLSDYIFPGYYFISYFKPYTIVQFLASYWITSLLILLALNWFQLKQRQMDLEKENNQVKLTALKSQLNPHFLFNSLNNIYGLIPSELKSQRTYMTKLSDTLRYMLYETEDNYVLLEDEIEYLENYISLEKLRLNQPGQVQVIKMGNLEGHLIAPLILLPILENCFKHKHPDNDDIKVEIRVEGDKLCFHTLNQYDPNVKKGGVGLENLKKRLELIYPYKHQLDIKKTSEYFNIKLEIDLNVE